MSDVAPSSPSGGSSAPLTFEAAFAAENSPASTPADPSSTPAPAESGQDAPAADAPADDRSPFIPRPRFDEINTERKTLKEWREQHAWADGIDPQAFTQVRQWFDRARADPDGFLIGEVLSHSDPMTLLDTLLSRIQSHPTHSQALRSFIGRKLAQQKADVQPEFLIPQADGSIAVDMTALQKWQAWQEAKISQKLLGEIAPIKERMAAEDRARQADEFATTTSQDAMTWPGMENDGIRHAVAAEYWRMVEHQHNLTPEQLTLALNTAWRNVAIPKLREQSQSSLLDNLKQKAYAASGVAPGGAAPANTRRPVSFTDPSLQW